MSDSVEKLNIKNALCLLVLLLEDDCLICMQTAEQHTDIEQVM